MTIVDIYCRISTDPQEDGTSLDEQERCGREYCREHGLTVGLVHREIWSGYEYRERKKLSLMRERYRDGKIQGVVIRTLDRLSRSQTHVAILFEEMEHYNVAIHCVKEQIDNTPMGKFARMVLAFVAEMEREKILDRTLTGRVNAAKNGKIVSGVKPLYGLKWHDPVEKDYLMLDDEQTATLQRAAEEYADGESLHTITDRFRTEGIPAPNGGWWHTRTLRRILTDPRMTGQNITIFNVKNKRAKQHLESVELPEGTYPRILSDELYQKVLDRASTNSALATRNSRTPERFLLRAGFVKCAYCEYVMTARSFVVHGNEYVSYTCPNPYTNCKHFTVPSDKLDEAVWSTISVLADHIALLEQSIELAMKNKSVEDDLRAVEATLADMKQQASNFEDDLKDTTLRGDTRAGIRHQLDNANKRIEELETDKAKLMMFAVDRDKEREEYEKVLAWCKKVKQDGEEMSYTMKRDFLRLLGAYVLVERIEKRGVLPKWDIKVRLPQVEEIIYQNRVVLSGSPLRHYELRAVHR